MKVVQEGKGVLRRKEGIGVGGNKELARNKRVVTVEEAYGGVFVRDEVEEGSGLSHSQREPITTSLPVSGLQLILEESGSLVPESPLAQLSEYSRKALDASWIHSLQRTNGLIFSVLDKTMATKLADLKDIEETKYGLRGQEVGDQ